MRTYLKKIELKRATLEKILKRYIKDRILYVSDIQSA